MKGVINNTNDIIRGPARLLYRSTVGSGTGLASAIAPLTIAAIIPTVAMDGACASDWTDFGAVDGAVTHQREITSDEDVVENSTSPIRSVILGSRDIVIANLAEISLENLQVAWELGGISTNSSPTPNERTLPLAAPESFTERMIAFVYAKPDGTIRAHIFWKVTLAGVASGVAFAKTPKGLIPVQFNAQVVTTITDSNGNPTVGKVIEQVSA